MLLRAGAAGGSWVDGGGLLCVSGRIARVLTSPAAVRRARRVQRRARVVDLGARVLTAGLVNAHAHLELTGLRGKLAGGSEFVPWIRELIALKAKRSAETLARDARAGAWRCLETGTTCVGDIDSTGAGLRGLRGHPLRARIYREALDAGDPARTDSVLRALRKPLARSERRWEGFAPHAPFTVSAELLRGIQELADARSLPVTVHWSETGEELDWLLRARGPLGELLRGAPLCSGLELLDRAGLLNPGTSLVHGNHPQRGEPERIARGGCVLVHCPGSHRFFGRERFAFAKYARAGVAVAFGTDSLASNEDLDLRREMGLFRGEHPSVAPGLVWRMATIHGARAVGLEAGELREGAWADCVAWSCEERTRARTLEELAWGRARVERLWVGGREVVRCAAARRR
jgi:aminodeoxyfutalosine deaminase